MKKERKKFYELALKEWGEDSQLRMCIEEMSELTKEICKYMRLIKSGNLSEAEEKIQKAKDNIKEEIADVMNTAEQLALIFGEEEVEKIRDQKMARELGRLQEQKEKQ